MKCQHFHPSHEMYSAIHVHVPVYSLKCILSTVVSDLNWMSGSVVGPGNSFRISIPVTYPTPGMPSV